jgi:hypothetical protein
MIEMIDVEAVAVDDLITHLGKHGIGHSRLLRAYRRYAFLRSAKGFNCIVALLKTGNCGVGSQPAS